MRNDKFERILQRRQKISGIIEQSLAESPQEISELLTSISRTYYKGKVTYFWDFLATLSGNDRGYGNDWFFTACELLKQKTGKEVDK